MKNYVENSRVLKLVIIPFSLIITLSLFIPIFIELTSVAARGIAVIIMIVTFFVIEYKLRYAIDNYIDSCIEQNRKIHVEDFFNFIESDKEYQEILKRITPIKREGKEIGHQTIYSAVSDMKWVYYNKIDLNK